MCLNFMLIFGGAIIYGLVGHWIAHPVRQTDPFWI